MSGEGTVKATAITGTERRSKDEARLILLGILARGHHQNTPKSRSTWHCLSLKSS
jgi:hypothetical protein